jgi:hypothetical protein
MPAERLSIRKVREVLRLRHALGLSYPEISEVLRVGKTSVGEFVRRASLSETAFAVGGVGAPHPRASWPSTTARPVDGLMP